MQNRARLYRQHSESASRGAPMSQHTLDPELPVPSETAGEHASAAQAGLNSAALSPRANQLPASSRSFSSFSCRSLPGVRPEDKMEARGHEETRMVRHQG